MGYYSYFIHSFTWLQSFIHFYNNCHHNSQNKDTKDTIHRTWFDIWKLSHILLIYKYMGIEEPKSQIVSWHVSNCLMSYIQYYSFKPMSLLCFSSKVSNSFFNYDIHTDSILYKMSALSNHILVMHITFKKKFFFSLVLKWNITLSNLYCSESFVVNMLQNYFSKKLLFKYYLHCVRKKILLKYS